MTERGARHVERSREHFRIGPSHVHWDGQRLDLRIEERASPLPRPVRGWVTLHPLALTDFVAALDSRGRHRWGPIAPRARIEVAFEQPALAWRGHAYFDSNEGDEPVTEAFTAWDWLRAPLADGSTAVVYDVRESAARGERLIARRFAPDGSATPFDPGARQALPRSGWRVARHLRSAGTGRIERTLEDTPFYARSLVRCDLLGESVHAVHESLDARRLAHPVVQAMLPVRMPRRA